MAVKRAYTLTDIRAYRPNVLPFDGRWLASVGSPELTGTWLIWGASGNGKTRFALQLAKYLAGFCRVAYDSLEEGLSLSMQKAIEEVGMSDVRNNFTLLDKEPLPELAARLSRRRAPQAVIIDSLQYTGLSYADYRALRDTHRSTLFIFVSHSDGREPKGNVGKSVRYDAFVKIYVEGYRAFPQSRFGGGEPYTVWERGARKYWGDRDNDTDKTTNE